MLSPPGGLISGLRLVNAILSEIERLATAA
jgi:hypothetical protein